MKIPNNTIYRYYLFVFLKDFAFFSAVLIPFFTEWGHISLAQVTILQSWFMLSIFLLEVPTGAIADYFGRKYSIAFGCITIAFATLLYGSIPKFEIFFIAEFMYAMGVALISGADQALLYDSLKESGKESESNKIFGRAHSFNLLGMLIAAPIGGFIAFKFGLNAPLLFSTIPFFLAGAVAFSIKEPIVQEKTSESKRYFDIARKGFLYFYKHKMLRLLAIDSIVVASSAYFVIWLYQPLLKNLNVPIFYFGFGHALLVTAEILIASNFGYFEKIFGSGRSFLIFSAIITSISFFAVAIFPNILTLVLFILLAGGFGITRFELMSSYMNKFIPSEQRATVISSISMLKRFALVILNPIIGFAADRSLGLAFFILGLIPLLVFLFSPIRQKISNQN